MRLVLSALLLSTLPAQIWAQEDSASAVSPHQEQSAHAQLYTLLENGVDQGSIHDGMVNSMKDLFARDPDFLLIETAFPGAIDRIANDIRPVLVEYSERVRIKYRPQMIAALSSELSEADTLEIIDFYSSPIGQRVLQLVSTNYRADAVLETIEEDREATGQDVEKDLQRSAIGAIGDMTDEERQELFATVLANPSLRKMQQAMPKITNLRAQMEEEPMNADEEARLMAIVSATMESIVAEAGD